MWRCTTWYRKPHGNYRLANLPTTGGQRSTPHTRPSTSLKRPCSVSVSVSLVWSFGTINKPRMNVFDCRRQFKGIPATDVIRCVGHFSSFTHSVSRPLMKYIRIGWGQKIGISVWAENDVLSLTLDYQLPELIPTNSNSGLHSWMLSR